MINKVDALKFGFLTSFISFFISFIGFTSRSVARMIWFSVVLSLIVSVLVFIIIEFCEGIEKSLRDIFSEDETIYVTVRMDVDDKE